MTYTKLAAVLAFSFLITSCEESYVPPKPQPNMAPTIYHFERNGSSSIEYSGQVVRQLLIQDMKTAIDKLGEAGAGPITANDLLKYFDQSVTDGATLRENIRTNVGNFQTTAQTYFDIHPDKDLLGKLATGFNLEATIRGWIDLLVENSNNPTKLGNYLVYIDDATGIDLAQAINKTLLGAVVFSQGVNVYLADIETRENNSLRENENSTDREHRFDEAFGYFGAARNFFDFSDSDLAGAEGGKVYKDNFVQDSKIDFNSEYNFGFSTNAGKRDRGSVSGTDLTKTIMDAFLQGRTAIVNKDDLTLIDARATIISTWEKVIASTVIHYINEVTDDLNDLQANPAASPKNFYKHWSEMYFFAQAFRYNANTPLDQSILLEKMAINGSANPKYLIENLSEIDDYKAGLLAARDIFQSTYDFNPSDVQNW